MRGRLTQSRLTAGDQARQAERVEISGSSGMGYAGGPVEASLRDFFRRGTPFLKRMRWPISHIADDTVTARQGIVIAPRPIPYKSKSTIQVPLQEASYYIHVLAALQKFA